MPGGAIAGCGRLRPAILSDSLSRRCLGQLSGPRSLVCPALDGQMQAFQQPYAQPNKGTLVPGQSITVNKYTVVVERYLSQGPLCSLLDRPSI